MPTLYQDKEKDKILFVQKNRCKGCDLCINVCPNKALVRAEELNKNVQYPPTSVENGKCTFCRLCEYTCPDFSIYIAKLSEVEAK